MVCTYVKNCRSGGVTMGKAAKLYNIPKTTICEYIRSNKFEFKHYGRKTLLSAEKEQQLAEYMRYGYFFSL